MSPIPKARSSVIGRLWQLILPIDSLGILFATATSHLVTWASRTATGPATGRRQAGLASYGREETGHLTRLARARHAAAQAPDLIPAVGAAAARDHQFPRYGYSALTESHATPPGEHPRTKRRSPGGITNSSSAWPTRSTAALRFPDFRKILRCGQQRPRMGMLSHN
jgi:hypothetical protein